MKIKKLWIHKQGNDKHAILLNPKEFPEIVVGDVVEIYPQEEEYSRMLLQITYLPEDTQAKENVVSIEQSVATAFNLKMYKSVIVNKVDKKAVTLDLVEVLFKDQYYSRSDMHRMRNSCVGTCVYLNKKIDFSEMRVSINELWCKGEKVTCGVISEDTKIVFRSTTAVVQIFIQMSSEMWEFDINGDLYFEKAVNGFLTDLYAKWKEQSCLHDVTIVMFSRTFYEAQSREEFPQWMQECLQKDHQGRFYEDFYRIVVQNERYEEWRETIKQLRKIFYEYPTRVLNYHRRHGYKVPKAYNSTAAEGNFLETLNMTLNLFEKYYLDRNFDRTGKVAVVITPGAGVFEVDRELTNITKQRTIDCGVGSDLVCMGEQPLHAAPLFKFHSKNQKTLAEVGDDYNIPHWMNHSFYTSKNQIQFYSNKTFVPRIKIPLEIFDKKKIKDPVVEQDLSYSGDDDNFPFVDYDEYDAQVFKLPNRNTTLTRHDKPAMRSTKSRIDEHSKYETLYEAKLHHVPRTRHISDDVSLLPVEKCSKDLIMPSPSLALSIPSQSTCSSGDDFTSSHGSFPGFGKKSLRGLYESDPDRYFGARPIVGSAGSPVGHQRFLHNYKRHRALINPFAPSRMQFKMTSNRRRWVHAFPTDPHGVAVQTHHVHTYSYNGDNDNTDDEEDNDDGDDTCELTPQALMAAESSVKARQEQGKKHFNDSFSNGKNCIDYRPTKTSSYDGQTSIHSFHRETKQVRSSLWGPTGEQEWSPELTTGLDWRPLDDIESIKEESLLIKPILAGYFQNTQNFCAGISVDWKSLTMPASLPITTDYFPDNISLHNDYVVSDYSLLPDDVNSDFYLNRPRNDDEQYYRKQPLTLKEVFRELISQRLAQGFQLITVSKITGLPQILGTSHTTQRYVLGTSPQLSHMSGGLMRSRPREDREEEVYLSIGRIFHKLTLSGPTITVTRYRPRHPHPQMCYSYRYRFQAPDSFNYDVSWSEFRNEKLENYNWNYLDQYICTRGEGDFGLMESLKFWRSRFYVLPCNNPATKKIIDGHERCDIYEERNISDLKLLVVGFTRYLEILNKMKRTAITRQFSCKHTEFLEKNPNGIPQPDTRPEAEVLTINSSSEKIVAWMLDEQCGVPMLPKQQGLPELCFISAEVVDWCYYHVKGVKGVKSAMAMLQRVLDDGCIMHASGSTRHKMIYGFYIFKIVSKDKSLADQGLTYNPLFQNDWCEVAYVAVEDVDTTLVKFTLDNDEDCDMKGPIVPNIDWRVETGLDKSGQTWGQQSATLIHKYVNVDVDPQNKGDRPEWATARYHAYYSPFCAFELQVQWMVSTGCILGDLIANWGRKAAACGFHLLPVPIDPFALPTAPDSDPLRGPIFVPLNISCLEPSGSLFQEYDQDTQQLKFLQLQEAIIKRFGFMASSVSCKKQGSSSLSGHNTEDYHQYVHCTGGMYVIIEDTYIHSTTTSPSHQSTSSKLGHLKNVNEYRQYDSLMKKSSAEMRKDYIARQTSETFRTSSEQDFEVGYLWSWNFMSSKRWRSANTGDEHFQDKVLSDFRSFCSNDQNRLVDFWNAYRENNYC